VSFAAINLCVASQRVFILVVYFFITQSGNFWITHVKWSRMNPGRIMAQFKISQLVGASYGRAASVRTASNGFVRCGIWAANPGVLPESDYVPYSLQDSISIIGGALKSLMDILRQTLTKRINHWTPREKLN
jgi:hypothetical protein